MRLYLLELGLKFILGTLIKTHNFVTFYEFLSHLGMHHTTYNVLPQSAKGTRNWAKKLDSCAAKKVAKKIVNSNFTKILE